MYYDEEEESVNIEVKDYDTKNDGNVKWSLKMRRRESE